MTVEEASGPPVEIWPDNMNTVNVFTACATQWRVNIDGPFALDYGVLPSVLQMMAIPKKEWHNIFEGIRVMEDAALEQIRQKRL